MPKLVFKYCANVATSLFEKVCSYEPRSFLNIDGVHKPAFYTNFSTSLLTAFSQLSGGV